MSKMKLNPNLEQFLQKHHNKIAIGALSLSILITITSCSMLKTNKKNELPTNPTTSISQQQEEDLLKLKTNIEKNIENIEVVKDDYNGDGAYQITEELYKQCPIYKTDENGNKYVSGYAEESRGIWMDYTVTYLDAEKMGITELLESKVIGYTKSK